MVFSLHMIEFHIPALPADEVNLGWARVFPLQVSLHPPVQRTHICSPAPTSDCAHPPQVGWVFLKTELQSLPPLGISGLNDKGTHTFTQKTDWRKCTRTLKIDVSSVAPWVM